MAKTSMAEIARIVGQVARLDARGKRIVRDYLVADLAEDQSVPPSGRVESGMVPEISVTRYKEGGE